MSDELEEKQSDELVAGEIQIILSEKRTALSTLRTGIAIIALPMTVMSFLVATSGSYNFGNVKGYLTILAVLNLSLIVLGIYLVVRAVRKIIHFDQLIQEIKKEHSTFSKYLS